MTARAGFMVLDRDDRGALNNSITVNCARCRSRSAGDHQHPCIVAGEYTVNVKLLLATTTEPVRCR